MIWWGVMVIVKIKLLRYLSLVILWAFLVNSLYQLKKALNKIR